MTQKILFAGTPDIALPSLKSLAKTPDIEILGVLCPQDKKVGRKQILTPCAVKQEAIKQNLKVFEIQNKNDILSVYQTLKPELVVVIALGIIFPKEALDITPTINVHFSLLPKWRGASPVQSAILNGDHISGITLQKMVPQLDAGDILWQYEEEIGAKGTRELWEKWAETSALALPDLVRNYKILSPLSQDESQATHCGKFKKADGEIFPEKETAEEIMRKKRAFDVWPGIFISTPNGSVKILECSQKKIDKNSISLVCKEGTLWLQTIQRAGKSPASAIDVVRSRPTLFR